MKTLSRLSFFFVSILSLVAILGTQYPRRDNVIVVVKTADESVSSSITPQDDDDLFFSAGTNETWIVEYRLMAGSASDTPDLRTDFTLPAGASGVLGVLVCIPTQADLVNCTTVSYGSLNDPSLDISSAVDAGFDSYLIYTLHVTTTTTPGSVQLRWAQNTSNANATIMRAESHLVARRVS